MLMDAQAVAQKHTGGKAMSRDTHHLVPDTSGGWNIKRGGSDRASAHANTKAEAEGIGRTISKNQKTEFVSDSHGNDPYPPKG